MSKIENNCTWHFGNESGRSEGPFDASGQNFRQRPFASLLREAVQNSMDAHIKIVGEDGATCIPTVDVIFSFGHLKAADYPEFYKLRDHIKSCYESYSQNEDYRMFYKGMLDNFDDNYSDEIPYLKISDFNTTGMEYVPNDLSNSFQAFVRSSQISVKGDGSGAAGSHGYGKAAYYLLSPVRTIFVSTMNESGVCYFEGASIIGAHIMGDTLFCAAGYYDNNNGQPIRFDYNSGDISLSPIPDAFRRNRPGTDFYIMGFCPENIFDMCEEMIREALRSYWLAIYKGKISITIRPYQNTDITIDKSQLSSLMDRYFPESKDESKQLRTMNPRPYYEAYTKQGDGEKEYIKFTDVLPTIGEVTMYVKKCKTKFDKIIHMRKPLMLVYGLPKDDDNGFYGLFLCDNDKGDKILRRLENSSHTEWKASNYRDARNKIYPDGERALNEINEFTANCIKKMFGAKDEKTLDIAGLSDFLYVPDSLIEEDETVEHSIGQPNGEKKEDGSSIDTKLSGVNMLNDMTLKDNYGAVIIEDDGEIDPIADGDDISATGHGDSGGGAPYISGGDEPSSVKINSTEGKHWTILDVPIRVFCQKENGNCYHIVKIHTDNAFEKVKLVLSVGLEEEDEKKIPITYTDKGIARGNIIESFSLIKGTNTIKILFADNMAHTVIKKMYYEEK
mgnify:FL=1